MRPMRPITRKGKFETTLRVLGMPDNKTEPVNFNSSEQKSTLHQIVIKLKERNYRNFLKGYTRLLVKTQVNRKYSQRVIA